MEFDGFHDVCEKWMQEALPLLHDRPFSVRQTYSITLQSESYVAKPILDLDYGATISEMLEQLSNLPSFEVLADIVKSTPELASGLLIDGAGRRIEDDESQTNWLRNLVIYRFLTAYARSSETPEQATVFDTSRFESAYGVLIRYALNDTVPSLWLLTVDNLRLEIPKVELEPNLVIRQLTNDEKIQAVNDAFQFGSTLGARGFNIPQTYIEYRTEVSKPPMPNVQDIDTGVRGAITRLRLIRTNPIGVSRFKWSTADQPMPVVTSSFGPWEIPPWAFVGDSYLLSPNDAEAL